MKGLAKTLIDHGKNMNEANSRKPRRKNIGIGLKAKGDKDYQGATLSYGKDGDEISVSGKNYKGDAKINKVNGKKKLSKNLSMSGSYESDAGPYSEDRFKLGLAYKF